MNIIKTQEIGQKHAALRIPVGTRIRHEMSEKHKQKQSQQP